MAALHLADFRELNPYGNPKIKHCSSNQVFKESYTYTAPWPVYSLGWSQIPNTFRLGLASFIEEYKNKLHIVELFDRNGELVKIAEVDHPYPVTKLLWAPCNSGGITPDLFGTAGDYLRIWELPSTLETMSGANASNRIGQWERSLPKVKLRATLANLRRIGKSKRDTCAPLSSFDWSEASRNIIVTSSIDTTCTIWDLSTQQAKTQLIAHDREVFDVAFAKGSDIFASVGADGSVRMFDLRSLDHSTIIYETTLPRSNRGDRSTPTPEFTTSLRRPVISSHDVAVGSVAPIAIPITPADNPPLLKLSWNKQNPNFIATFRMNSSEVIILDIRVPAVPIMVLRAHSAAVNSICWAPHKSELICTAGDDMQALVWDISEARAKIVRDPILFYSSEGDINQLCWNSLQHNFVSMSVGSAVKVVKL